ncbi:tropinone reductase-like protein [Cinnamomum micranthum f. kanehirae]|uniref:Tropinone reductase-like protein n=1 Tax=Cinnamomum micranthum f. kanehirae TaxID=337451 RepID=A0A3S3MXE9_9MAGN|nr:tropinone reductase-like protein [Cinnamomum micranthum f. kanehirae]
MEGRRGERWSLEGATALVTGGSKGIGKTNLDRCLHEWEGKGFHVLGSVCDVSSRAERERLMEEVTSIFNGQLNILVNNAGITIVKPTVDYTTEELSTVMATNFDSAYHLRSSSFKAVRKRKYCIYLIHCWCDGFRCWEHLLSQQSFRYKTMMHCGIYHPFIYFSFSGAMNQLTRNLACEWAKDNIRVNSIAPWFIKTAILDPVIYSSWDHHLNLIPSIILILLI